MSKELYDVMFEKFRKYLAARSSDNARIRDEENFWRMRGEGERTAWLFNAIANKHADAMDNLPVPFVLPMNRGSEEASAQLSKILPSIYEETDFATVWSDVWYDKLKHGTGCFGVFWETDDAGGGAVRIRRVDVRGLCWEPGVSNIQDSDCVFYSKLCSRGEIERLFPGCDLSGAADPYGVFAAADGAPLDTDGKIVVTDCYCRDEGYGFPAVELIKFCGDKVLFSTVEDPDFPHGAYDHCLYPFFFDPLYPVKNSPCGFGLIEAMGDTQRQIDRLSEALTKSAELSSRARYFIRTDGSVNEEEFADFTRPFVHVQGSRLGDDSIRQISSPGVDGSAFAVLKHKIDELKETAGNRDFSQGGTTAGVTAASAITALQEAGNKLSRDMIAASYDVFRRMTLCVIELLRQFGYAEREYRVADGEGYAFEKFSSKTLERQERDVYGHKYSFVPTFDVKVSAERKSPSTRASQNEMAKEFFAMGLFKPERREEALACISMMDFEGKDKMIKMLSEDSEAIGIRE